METKSGPFAAIVLVAVALAHVGDRSIPLAAEKSAPTDHVETATVTLMLLDVEAIDRKGAPFPGLKKEDFSVRLNFRLWPIYSVDDFCKCGAGGGKEPPVTSVAAPSEDLSGTPIESAADAGMPPAPAAEPGRFILYFDFSELQMDGRLHAVREAERWVAGTMKPGDEAMLVAFAPVSGLKKLTPFTESRDLLLAEIDKVLHGTEFIDSFAQEIGSRMEECQKDPRICDRNALEEYWHGRQSMKVMETFIAGLERIPGRKTLLLFNQNGSMYPGHLYRGAGAPDHYQLVEEVAAAANAARTSVYAINAGSNYMESLIAGEALVLNDNLADYTGGNYNRGPSDMSRLTEAAGRGCRCVYRIGLVPPDHPPPEVLSAKVVAAGVLLPHRYRVRFLAEPDRWLMRAQSVLADPSSARDLDLSAAIFPESAGKEGWDVSVEMAFDTSALTLLPSAKGRLGSYEVGALLNRRDGSNVTEMLGEFAIHAEGERPGGLVVHSRKISGLPSGEYRLAAFVRDRTLNVFGGAEAGVSLPDPKKGGTAGPLLFLGPRSRSVLPLRLMGRGAQESLPPPMTDRGIVPLSPGALRAGSLLTSLTWICPGKQGQPSHVLRFLAQDGMPISRFESSPPAEAGLCLRYADVLDTASVPVDAYAYHIRWRPGEAGESLDAQTGFEIVDPTRRPVGPPVNEGGGAQLREGPVNP